MIVVGDNVCIASEYSANNFSHVGIDHYKVTDVLKNGAIFANKISNSHCSMKLEISDKPRRFNPSSLRKLKS